MIVVEEVRQILFKAEGGGIGPRAMGSCSGSDTSGSTPQARASGDAQPRSRLGDSGWKLLRGNNRGKQILAEGQRGEEPSSGGWGGGSVMEGDQITRVGCPG